MGGNCCTRVLTGSSHGLPPILGIIDYYKIITECVSVVNMLDVTASVKSLGATI